MKIAYFSPLGPQPSGIADYSEELLPHLAQGAEITLFVEGFEPANEDLRGRFPVRDYIRDPTALDTLNSFDALLYHMGNDHRYHVGVYETMRRHAGIAVFHDFALQDFFLGLARARGDARIYTNELTACHGNAVPAQLAHAVARPLDFPLNCRLARQSEAIIVHSEWNRARFEKIAPGVPVRRVFHHITQRAAASPRAARNVGEPVRIASFGLINPDKGIERALRVLAQLRDVHDFHYSLVGQPNQYFDVHALIREYRLSNYVEITGYVTLEEFERRIAETDIAINLRERTVGETSGSLCRIMAAGVCAIVSDVGWYGELPSDCAVKIERDGNVDELLSAYLERLIVDVNLRERIGANARRYVVAAHDIQRSAEEYLSFIQEVIARRPRRKLLSGISEELSLVGIDRVCDGEFARRLAQEIAEISPERLVIGIEGNTTIERDGCNSRHSMPIPSNSAKSSLAVRPKEEPNGNGRLRKIAGVNYKRAAVDYPSKLDEERHHYLYTKPFYNLANKPPKHEGDGMDRETFRHFCDFANVAVALALPPGSRILDVGCGSGWLSEYFARLGYDVTGIDISPELIGIATERVARVPYAVDHESPLRCRFLVHDVEDAPLFEHFDAVVCYDSLHHFEDESAVLKHLAAMTRYGGELFILEGDLPPTGSATEEELIDVMRQYETLESPFSREYLGVLLETNGFAVIGDYVSVNGLFEREAMKGDSVRVDPPEVNYLLCKKVTHAGESAASVPDSKHPSLPAAAIDFAEPWPNEVAPGTFVRAKLNVANTGDTLWLVGAAERAGSCMLGIRMFDHTGALVYERHGIPTLPRALAPGETVSLRFELRAPYEPGLYKLKLDIVAQHVCWFEQCGSIPLTVQFRVCLMT
ncbi:MAG: methyltransferase domain-containing protein [Pyrinomonadaceae bacterium]